MSMDDAIHLRCRDRMLSKTSYLSHHWASLAVQHVVSPQLEPYEFSLHSSRHYIALMNGYRRDGETAAEDLPRSTLRDIQGKLVFIPAGCRMSGWSQPAGMPITFTAAYIEPSICTSPTDGTYQPMPMVYSENPLLAQLMLRLDGMLAQPESYSRIYTQSLAVVLLTEVMNGQAIDLSRSSRTQRGTPIKGGLASWQCKAVRDYIEENLHQDISLAELAAIARLSPYHFCRAFKEAIGEPPHRYQMSRRIEHAKELLAKPSLSVSEVAATVGYGSLSRFSALFRQVTGHSPRDYRRMII
jgi:AraC family transcriptional regulator